MPVTIDLTNGQQIGQLVICVSIELIEERFGQRVFSPCLFGLDGGCADGWCGGFGDHGVTASTNDEGCGYEECEEVSHVLMVVDAVRVVNGVSGD